MKKFLLSTFAAAFVLSGLCTSKVNAALINTNAVITQVAITAVVAGSTNVVTNTSGDVLSTTITGRTIALNARDILRMLAIEFETNFPAGSQLAFGVSGPNQGFQVVDRNGTFLLDVSSIMTLSTNVTSTSLTTLTTGRVTSNPANNNATQVLTQLTPDSGLFYKDHQGNEFNFVGVLTSRENGVTSGGNSVDRTLGVTLVGSGGGTFQDPRSSVTVYGVFTRAQLVGSGRNIRLEQ